MEERLPEGWVWTTLGEISTKPQYGWTTKAKSTEGTVLLLRTTDISSGAIDWTNVPYCTEVPENLDDYLLRPGDIVISRAGSVGISYLLRDIPKETVFASYLIRFHPLQGSEPQYIAYYLQTPAYWHRIYEESSGIALANVNARKLETIEIPLAPTNEQHRIVAAIEQHFSRIDNAVASLQHAREKAKQYRASLLRSAVEGELTKEWRAEHPVSETGEQLLTRILAERRARWEEEQLAKMREKGITPKDDKWKLKYKEPQGPDVKNLPELPEGWCWATLGQVVTRSEYGTSVKCDYNARGVPVLRIPNIAAGTIDLTDMKYAVLPITIDEESALRIGDLLVCRTNGSLSLIGKAALVKTPLEPFHSFASYLLRFRFFEAIILPHWLYLFISSPQGRAFIEMNSPSSAGQHNISLSLLHSMPFPLPPLTEQEQIVAEVEAGLSNIAKLEEATEHSLKKAEHDQQSILQEAFAGRLVEQDPNDEPASVLLERIREERRRREEAEKATRASRKGGRMKRAKARPTAKGENGQQETGLYKTLVEAGKPLAPDDLFKRVGLQTDEQPESVEEFYAELHTDVAGGWIKETRPDKAQVLLEALEPPPDELADEEEEEASHSSETQAAYEQHKLFEARESVAEPQPPEQRSERLRQATLWNE